MTTFHIYRRPRKNSRSRPRYDSTYPSELKAREAMERMATLSPEHEYEIRRESVFGIHDYEGEKERIYEQ